MSTPETPAIFDDHNRGKSIVDDKQGCRVVWSSSGRQSKEMAVSAEPQTQVHLVLSQRKRLSGRL